MEPAPRIGDPTPDPAVTELSLNIWRLHPQSCPIAPADRNLRGTAPQGAARFCGPFVHANRAGWWLFPPVDVDITWRGGREFEYELLTPYSNADMHLIRFLLDERDVASPHYWLPEEGRTKFTFGLVEPGVVQIWTGLIFETPPGWGLHMRSPINCAPRGFHVMDAVLETDWMQYDIWMNLVFHHVGERISLRRNEWPPVAQIVPIRREVYEEDWQVQDRMLDRNTAEANRVFEYFVQYNEKKYSRGGKHRRSRETPTLTKDSTTYYRERRRVGRPSTR